MTHRLVSQLNFIHDVFVLMGRTLLGYQSHSAQEILASLTQPVVSGEEASSAPGGAPFGINFRTLGNVAYFMTSLNTPAETVRAVEDRLWSVLGSVRDDGA